MPLVMIYFHQVQSLVLGLFFDTLSTIMIILYICGVGDGVTLSSTIISYICVGDYCDFTLSVLMFQFSFYFDSSQAMCVGSSLHGDDYTTRISSTTRI